MKKLLIFLVSIFIILSFTACNKSDNAGEQAAEIELARVAADRLGVPEKDGITYEFGEKLYWEAGQVYFKDITFYENGKVVAGASVNLENGELLKNILLYPEDDA